jgi:HrpA-like RNA helicase
MLFLRKKDTLTTLSLDIAETSVTIEDISFVIDTGRAKEKSYDPHLKTSTLQDSWISQASAKQRRGRAGRCKAGVCFHLFSRRRHGCMREFIESELLRTPLEELCLQTKRLKLAQGGPDDLNGIPAFLSKAMSPPHSKAIINALELLVDLGAMDEETNELTDLGVCLSALSLEPRVGKMLIMSHLIGCTGAAACMGIAMTSKSPFAIPPKGSMQKASDSAKVNLSEGSESDQITCLNVIRSRDAIAKRGMSALTSFCKKNYLNFSSLNQISDLRSHVSRELESLGFPPSSHQGYHNRNGDYLPAFLQAAICAGLYPNLAWRRKGDVNYSTITRQKAKIHLSSVNAVKTQPLSTKCQVAEDEVEMVVFGELVKGKTMFTMENTTHLVSPLPLLLLCGHLNVRPITFAATETSISTTQSVLSVDDWLVFLCAPDVASALVVLRKRIDSAFKSITSDPCTFSELPDKEKDAIDTLSAVLQSGHHQSLRQRKRTSRAIG